MYQSSADLFLTNGYRREAAKVYRAHAKLLSQFAADCYSIESKHDYLLQTHLVLEQTCALLNESWCEVASLQSLDELNGVSLPVQRELIDAKLESASLLAEVLEQCLNEVKADNSKNLGKNNIVKTVENFVNEDDVASSEGWMKLLAKTPDLLMAHLSSSHLLAAKLPQQRSETLYLIGRALRLVADLQMQLRVGNLNDKWSSTTLALLHPVSKWSSLVAEAARAYQMSTIDLDTNSKPKSKISKMTGVENDENEDFTAAENSELENLTASLMQSNLANLIEQEHLKVNSLSLVGQKKNSIVKYLEGLYFILF